MRTLTPVKNNEAIDIVAVYLTYPEFNSGGSIIIYIINIKSSELMG